MTSLQGMPGGVPGTLDSNNETKELMQKASTGARTPCNPAGTIDFKEMEATYRISRRIEGEERALDAVSCVFTSTQQEVAEQWGTYDG